MKAADITDRQVRVKVAETEATPDMNERICCVCRVKHPIRKMIRIARIKKKDGSYKFVVDRIHSLDGRGCHICPECVESAIKTRALNRSFKMPVPDKIYDKIKVLSDKAALVRTENK